MRTVIHVTVASFLIVMFPVMGSEANLFVEMAQEHLSCDEEIQKTFICKKNLFNSSEKFRLSFRIDKHTKKLAGYCINENRTYEIPPWVFYTIEKTDDLEKTLVIDPKKAICICGNTKEKVLNC